tara:strand:+ start:556 stop:711 length:156 start_codon:yes stop_codon:yes gene_type:complete
MFRKISLVILALSLGACASVKEKTGGLKGITDTCPPLAERTLKDILCKEAK